MSDKEIGCYGENIACYFLENKGYKILERNYLKEWSSVSKGEIDIIAKKQGVISFVEVKSSVFENKEGSFSPESRVDFSKIKQIIKVAHSWLVEKNISLNSKWQVDIVALRIDLDAKKAKVKHLENASF